ncbi:MAG: hypothetical protein ACHQCH_00945 [Solirubrobacterales bacterium]
MLHAILCLLPAIALVLPLLARRYPGERVLGALRSERRVCWPRPLSSVPVRRRARLLVVRGGQLLGSSLASRPPPALHLAS